MPSSLRWGILSTGKIAQDFVTAIQSSLDPSQHSVLAVSSRSINSANEFAERFSIPKTYEGLAPLLTDPEVDIIYIASINTEHYNACKAALEAGKHVLCEKPMGMNADLTESLISLAKTKGVFLLEAIWSRFLPSYEALRAHLPSIGEVQHVDVAFGRKIRSERIRRMDLGGGTVLDLGVYCVQLLNLVFTGEEPSSISSKGSLNAEKTDRNTSSLFAYGDGCRMASISTHSELNMPCEANIFGSQGSIKLPFPFWVPERIEVHLEGSTTPKVIHKPVPALKDGFEYNFINSAGLSFEAQHVKECLDKGYKESPLLTHKDMLQISKHMEKIRKDVGVVYPQDSML